MIKKFLVKKARKIYKVVFPTRFSERLIIMLYKLSDVNLLRLSYRQAGLLNYQNFQVSGELIFLKNIIAPHLTSEEALIDIGANTGEYTKMLMQIFPNNKIYSVEPNPKSFIKLLEINKNSFNLAISDEYAQVSLYIPQDDRLSNHASLSRESIQEGQVVTELIVQSIRLIDLINLASIGKIGILKVDVEGYELSVLKSGLDILSEIKAIQFEFNEKHIYTRTFLKDFYNLLDDSHVLYRLHPKGLIDMRQYSPMNEIFRFQNIVAVRKDIEPNPLND